MRWFLRWFFRWFLLIALPLVSALELTICTGNRCWRNGAGRLIAASQERAAARFSVRGVGCSGVCPVGAVSVCEGPTSGPIPAMQLAATTMEEAERSSARAVAALEAGEAVTPAAAANLGCEEVTPPSAPNLGRASRCEYCGAVLPSRNKYYQHLRESSCGEQAVLAGLNLEAGRQRRQTKVALSVSYGDLGGTSVEECASTEAEVALRAVLEANEGQGGLTITSASSWTFRRSRLFQQRLPALEDVFVYAGEGCGDLDRHATTVWLERVNAALEARGSSTRVLGREALHKDLAQLNAEQACSARVFECVLPLSYLTADGGDGSSIAEVPADADPDAEARNFKRILRTLCSPKSATRGGFRHRRSKLQEEWKAQQRWHNFADASAVPTDASVAHPVDRFWVHGSQAGWHAPIGPSGRRFVRIRVSGIGILDGQVARMVGTAICISRGLLPSTFSALATDPHSLVETPSLPAGLIFLREVRYDWHSEKQPLFRRRTPLAGFESSQLRAGLHAVD